MCVFFLPGCTAHLQYLPDHSDAHARGCVLLHGIYSATKNASFYQDRLGTYIGKAALIKGRVSVGVLRSPSVGARYGGSAAAAATAVAGEQRSGAAAVAVVGGGGDDGSPVPTVGFVTGMPGSVMEAGESKVRRESKTRQETPSSFNLRWCHSTATKTMMVLPRQARDKHVQS